MDSVKANEKDVEIQRIAASAQFRDAHAKPILSDSDDTCSEGSDDSNNELNWKRSKVANKTHPCEGSSSDQSRFASACHAFQNVKSTGQQRPSKPVNKFDVWSNVLQERGLVEDLNSVGVIQRDYLLDSERDCESYDYTLKYGLDGQQLNPHHIHRRLGRKRSTKDRKETQLQALDRSKRSFEIKEGDSEETVSSAIVAILRETKGDLISRVVNTLGTKKSLELLRMTEDIEEAGGLMTFDNSRRRTPGGVFLQLLRTDRQITKMDKDKIFELEREEQVKAKKEMNRSKRRRKIQDLKAKRETAGLMPALPSLPTLGEVLANKTLAESDKMEADSEKEPGELDSDDDDSNDLT